MDEAEKIYEYLKEYLKKNRKFSKISYKISNSVYLSFTWYPSPITPSKDPSPAKYTSQFPCQKEGKGQKLFEHLQVSHFQFLLIFF